MEFPRLVYRSASDHTLAEDEEQYAKLIKDGWFGSVPEAKAKKHDTPVVEDPVVEDPVVEDPVVEDPVVEDPPTRAELETKAKELGIGFNKNTPDKTLLERINENLVN